MARISGRTAKPRSGRMDFTIDRNATFSAPQDWEQVWIYCTGIPYALEDPEEYEAFDVPSFDDRFFASMLTGGGPFDVALLDQRHFVTPDVRNEVRALAEVDEAERPAQREREECFQHERTLQIGFIHFDIPDSGEYTFTSEGSFTDRYGTAFDVISITVGVRGQNPTRSQVSAALGNDLLRAICWAESSWRQFIGGRPLVNRNSNGTADWGLMQINGAPPEQRWNWKLNVARGAAILAEKRAHAKAYLDRHPPYTEEMLENETIQRYNGGAYYRWRNDEWVVAPPNGYVGRIRELIANRPWAP